MYMRGNICASREFGWIYVPTDGATSIGQVPKREIYRQFWSGLSPFCLLNGSGGGSLLPETIRQRLSGLCNEEKLPNLTFPESQPDRLRT